MYVRAKNVTGMGPLEPGTDPAPRKCFKDYSSAATVDIFIHKVVFRFRCQRVVRKICIYFFTINFATRAGSPQQREPITVGPYYLSHPVNIPCGRKPTTFGRALTILFSHEDWVRVYLTGDRTRNLRAPPSL